MGPVSERLYSHFDARVVGEIWLDRTSSFCFRYDDTWIERDAWPISQTLPLTTQELHGGPAHTFFANLLPEGGVRTAVCRRLGISESNDFTLLEAIGGECAGALTIGPDRRLAVRREPAYERLTRKRLQRLVDDDELVPLLAGGPSTRLSLAGAQDKLPVALIDGELHLPLEGAPSTHILKLPNPRYPHLPINEAFVMGLARRIGLEVVETTLYTEIEPTGLLVTRYDRRPHDGETIRLHQEDFCQALGLPPSRKYEQENGPTLAVIIELARSRLTRPLGEVNRLLEWQVFNAIAGNSDGHGKNLSIVYEAKAATLAPFYDLVATRHYESIDRSLALSIGGRRDPDQLHRAQWERFAADVGVAPRIVVEIVERLADRTRGELATYVAEFRAAYGRQAILQTLPGAIEKRARAMLRRLAR